MKALIIIQARMGSSRFPGKSLAEIAGKPTIWYLFRQVAACRGADETVLATTDGARDDALAAYAESQSWSVFRGHESDVLNRYCQAARAYGASARTAVVRLTGDDVFSDPRLIDALLGIYASLDGAVDAVYTERSDRFPYGSRIEVFSFRSIEEADKSARGDHEREHVSPFIINNPDLFPAVEVSPSRSLGGFPLSIDYPEDLERTRRLIDEMDRHTTPPYALADVLAACRACDTGGPSPRLSEGEPATE